MSKTNSINKLPEKNKLVKIPSLEDCVFNSKLFIDLDSTYEQSSNYSFDKDLENSNEIDDDIDNGCFLIKELMEELDSPESDISKGDKKEELKSYGKSLLPLVNNGYEFIPKEYRKNVNNNSTNKNIPKSYNKFTENFSKSNLFFQTKHKSIKERKGDWFCKLCQNLNFSFRTQCNRCKTAKEECIQK